MSTDASFLDLNAPVASSSVSMPWRDPASYWGGMTRAIDGHDGAVAAINLAALRYNAHDLVVRAAGTPIRVASKSIRIRAEGIDGIKVVSQFCIGRQYAAFFL